MNPNAKRMFSTRKLVLTAMMACLAFVLNTCVWFPAMAPFQHFVNALSAVFIGPWYGAAAGAICGVMRMMCGRDIGSVIGAVFGPILGGLLYRKTKNIWLVAVGETIGTGIVSAIVVYPFMKLFYGLDVQNWMYYIPFYTPSAVVGSSMGVAVLLILQKTGLLRQMEERLAEKEQGYGAV